MAINDIITTIEEEVNVKIVEMRNEAEEKRNKLSAEYDEKILRNETNFLNEIKKKIDLKVKKQKFILNNSSNKTLLEKKWNLINTIYQKVLAELTEMEESKKEKIIKQWTRNCPIEGKIINSKKGGFIFQSDKIQIDNTFESVVRGLREETEVDVGKILFVPAGTR